MPLEILGSAFVLIPSTSLRLEKFQRVSTRLMSRSSISLVSYLRIEFVTGLHIGFLLRRNHMLSEYRRIRQQSRPWFKFVQDFINHGPPILVAQI